MRSCIGATVIESHITVSKLILRRNRTRKIDFRVIGSNNPIIKSDLNDVNNKFGSSCRSIVFIKIKIFVIRAAYRRVSPASRDYRSATDYSPCLY